MAAPAAGSAPHPRAAPAPPAATHWGGDTHEGWGLADTSQGCSSCRLVHPDLSPLMPLPRAHGTWLCRPTHQLGHPTIEACGGLPILCRLPLGCLLLSPERLPTSWKLIRHPKILQTRW